MKNIPKIEQKLRQTILPDLENGRPDWDKPHTISVVAKIKEIRNNNPELNLDPVVLVISAYTHD